MTPSYNGFFNFGSCAARFVGLCNRRMVLRPASGPIRKHCTFLPVDVSRITAVFSVPGTYVT